MDTSNRNNQIEFDEIDLAELFAIIKRNIIKIIIVGIVLGSFSFVFTKFFIDKQYESSGTLIVNTKQKEGISITSDEIRSAQNLASVFAIIIKSEPVLGQVISNLNLEMDMIQLSKLVSVNSVDQTQVMKVSVKTKTPELSSRIANEILNVSPEIIVDTVEAGSVKLISPARVNPDPVSPNIRLNTLIAAVLGIMLSTGAFILVNILDNTFKSEEDIERYLGVPLLGVIPNVESVKGGTK